GSVSALPHQFFPPDAKGGRGPGDGRRLGWMTGRKPYQFDRILHPFSQGVGRALILYDDGLMIISDEAGGGAIRR
ncbi:MAG TPA: hypothetical protein VFG12_08880, partial [Rhodopila sp.]|nr:hypothetical protein [Rhodopila sp.]